MNKLLYSLALILLVAYQSGFSQTKFLNEGFENNGSIPTGWTQIIKTGSASWNFTTGGALPPGSTEGLPPTAHTGTYNARFYKSSFSVHETFLVSPKFSFEFAQKPELRFWYSQYPDQLPGLPPDNSKIKIYYRTPEEGNVWKLLKELTTSTEGWVYDSVPIPDSITNKKYKEMYLGFLGISATASYGSCLDDILLVETDTVSKYIEKIYATQPNLDIIPTGSNDNPILRLRFPVQGNDGQLLLESLVVTALEKSAQIVAAGGVKLYHTTTDYFSSDHQVGTGQSFVNGKATFNNLNYELPYGNSYIWVTYNIPVDAQHQFKDAKVDAKIEANAIKVNQSLFPSEELSPSGVRKINESLFFDDFENDKGWSLVGEFERDSAKGLGGYYQNPDPNYAISGVKVLGTDLTGLGVREGDYESDIDENAYLAVSPNFDCTYYKDLSIQFYRWLNVNFGDSAGIAYSLDNGVTWQRFWRNSSLIAEGTWKFQQIGLATQLDRKPSVRFRFALGPTSASSFLSGWNIDNFAFTGTYINNDIGIASLVSPTGGCGFIGYEPLVVKVKNYGYDVTNDTLPVKYSLDDGSTWIQDTLFATIPQGGSTNFTFQNPVNFTQPGYYRLIISTNLANDEDSRNNTLDTTLFLSPTYTLPYFENFETNNGYWQKGGVNNTWEHGVPNGTVIKKAYSGTKCWTTKLSQDYPNNDSAWLISPCFNLSGIDKPIIDFMLRTDAEIGKDGLAVYYKVDDEPQWHLVPKNGSYDWNWYNNTNIEALGHAGWDSVTNNWFKARQILPDAVANESKVQFKFLFKSNSTKTKNGFAIDDIRFYNAPTDAGIASIVTPKNECYLSKTQQITVSVKNYGVRPIQPTDTLFASVKVNNDITLSDTFIVSSPIAVNGTANFTFNKTANLWNKKWHKMEAYTQVKGDTSYYVKNVSNDKKIDSAYVKGEPAYSLGPDIGTYNADTVILNGKTQSVGGNNFVHYLWKYIEKADSTPIADNRYFGVPQFPAGVNFMNFAIRVQNDSGCYAYDTIKIIKSQVDIGVFTATGLADKCFNNQNQTLSVTIKNYTSSYTMPAGSELSVGYSTSEDEFETETIESITLGSNLAPGSTINHNFASPPTFNSNGNFNVKIFTVVNADLAYSNDSLTAPIEIYAMPNVNIGPDSILTMQADTLEFDAGPGFNSYLWNDASNLQTLAINSNLSSWYSVTVTDVNSCGSDVDSVLVISDNWTIDTILNPISMCTPSASEQITVKLENLSPNTYSIGYKIPATIQVGQTQLNQIITLPSVVLPGGVLNHTFIPTFNFSNLGLYDVQVNLNPIHDFNRTDNLDVKSINVWGVKTVNIGPDTLITFRADTVVLDAGSGFATYEWHDMWDQQTYPITDQTSLKYWVSVTDFNNCPSSKDTIQIVATDLAIEELVSPEPKCNVTDINTITFTLRNTGRDVLYAGNVIPIRYNINGGAYFTQNYTLPYELDPDQTKQITLSENFGFVAGNTYKFKVYIDWQQDFNSENDTLTSTIYQLESPIINLGNDIFTLAPDTVVLRAPKGFTTYYWQNSSRADTFAVQNQFTDQYWVEVRNGYGCPATDTLMVYTYDIEPDEVFGLENTCDHSMANPVMLGVKLNGIDMLNAGTIISAYYDINGIRIDQNFTLPHSVNGGDTVVLKFSTPVSLIGPDDFAYTFGVSMVNEAFTGNNTLTGSVRVGNYDVELGSNQITYESELTLDAGNTGISSYLWNNGKTDQTITVSQTGTYGVTITDVNNCNASDSVNVKFMKPLYAITSIIGIMDSCTRYIDPTISVTLANQGNDTIFADSIITLTYSINNGSPISQNYTFTNKFVPGSQVTIPFNAALDLSLPRDYTVAVNWSHTYGSVDADTLVNTWGLPTVNLGNDINSYNEHETLNAGSGFVAYAWSTNESDQTIEVTLSDSYSVTVTNNRGCSNSDTINVKFIEPGYTISKFIGLADSCSRTNQSTIAFELFNSGTDTIKSNSNILIRYNINEESSVSENHTFTSNFNPGDRTTISFSQQADFTNTGNYEINLSVYVGSIESESDTVIHTFGIPQSKLPSDTTSFTESMVLDAGEGFASYLWNTSETSRTITITDGGTYWVKVSNLNGCHNTDTVNVRFAQYRMKVTSLNSPLVGCDPITNAEVNIIATNMGIKTIEAGSIITFGYQQAGNNPVYESVSLVSEKAPGSTLNYTFNTPINFNNAGIHELWLMANINSGINDTSAYNVSVLSSPIFEFEDDPLHVTSLPYILDPNVEAAGYLWSTGERTPTITVTTEGLYWLQTTGTNACTYTDSVTVIKGNGVEGNLADAITIYPNPASQNFNVKAPDYLGQVSIEVINSQGKTIFIHENAGIETQVDASTWAKGLYLIRVSSNNEIATFQIVIQ